MRFHSGRSKDISAHSLFYKSGPMLGFDSPIRVAYIGFLLDPKAVSDFCRVQRALGSSWNLRGMLRKTCISLQPFANVGPKHACFLMPVRKA